jgi:predicted transglutaminase-like cysteine proteinase
MLRCILACVTLACVLATAATGAEFSLPPEPSFVLTGAQTSRPIGHEKFCRTYPDECGANAKVIEKVGLTSGLLNELRVINDSLNAAITPVTDSDFYKVDELWVYPVAAGDCEDFVLAKRRALVVAGWPISTLLIAVVRQESGAGHAVLMVRTDSGDLVLDNLDPDVHVWNETPYTYVKRQSQNDAGRWVAIADDRGVKVVASH